MLRQPRSRAVLILARAQLADEHADWLLTRLHKALAAGASLAFITTLGDFVTSIVLYTYDTRPVSVEILSSLRLQDTGVAAVYGVFLMLVSATIFLLWGRQDSV